MVWVIVSFVIKDNLIIIYRSKEDFPILIIIIGDLLNSQDEVNVKRYQNLNKKVMTEMKDAVMESK